VTAALARARPQLDVVRRLAVPAIVFALPFEFTAAYLPYGLPLARLLILGAVAVLALDVLAGGTRLVLPRSWSVFWMVAFIADATVSWAATRNPGSVGSLAALLAYPLLTLLVLNLVVTEEDHRTVLVAIVASGVAVSLIGLGLWASGRFLLNPEVASVGRVNATFFDPDILARFLAMVAAAALVAAGGSSTRRWRLAMVASALLAAAVLPLTFSRVGLLLIVVAAGAAAIGLRPRTLAIAGATGVLSMSLLVVGLQPAVRDRALNMLAFISLEANPLYQPAPDSPLGEGAPVAVAKMCAPSGGWTAAPDPQALYGEAAELQAGSRDPSPLVFGQPIVLPPGRFHVWARVRVADPGSRLGELRQGLWDPASGAFVPGAFQINAPVGFTPQYHWLLLGTADLSGQRSLEFRAEPAAETTTAWYFDQFVVTSLDHPGSVRPGSPFGSGSAVVARPSPVSGGFSEARDADAPHHVAAVLPPHAAAESAATFAFPGRAAGGEYRLWALLRVGSPVGSQPELRASLVDVPGAGPVAGPGVDIRPADGCASYAWRPLGLVQVQPGTAVEARVTSVGVTTTDWHLDSLALVPVDGTASVTGARLAGAYHPGESPFKAFVARLPLDDERRYLIVGGLDMFRDHVLTGVGFGGFQHNLLGPYAYDIAARYHDTLSHNSLVTVLAEQGLIGFVVLLAAVLAIGREVRRAAAPGRRLRNYAIAQAVLLGLIALDSLFEGRLFTEPYLWVLLGLLYATQRATPAGRRDGRLSVLVLTHYYPPEVGAPQGRLRELAQRLVAKGVEVTVVTCFPNYPTLRPDPAHRRRLLAEERLDGVRVLRTWVWAGGNRRFVQRLANQVSFAASSLLALSRCDRPDVIFVESPPLTTGLAALAYSTLKRAPFVFNVSDIWPQSAVDLGALRNPVAIRIAEAFEMLLYRRAALVTVVTSGILDRLAARGVPREKLRLLTNGVDTTIYRPGPPDSALVRGLGLEGRKVILYAGTHGMAQGLQVVLDAARLVRDPELVFLLVGDGVEKTELMERASAEGLDNVRFLPSQPKETIPGIVSLALAAIVPLRKLELFRAALPSKMFEAMAAGKPIVLTVWGEAAALVERARCGIVVEPEDAAGIAAAVDRLAAEQDLATELGNRGRDLALAEFDRDVLAERCLDILRLAAGRPSRDEASHAV